MASFSVYTPPALTFLKCDLYSTVPFRAICAPSDGNHHAARVEGMLTFCRRRRVRSCTSSADLLLRHDQEPNSLGKLPASAGSLLAVR